MADRERRRSRSLRCVQVQFLNGGERAVDVQYWLDERFPHLAADVTAAPGLGVTMNLPGEHYDAIGSWYGRLMEANASCDLALEILNACLEELAIEPSEVLALHLTREL